MAVDTSSLKNGMHIRLDGDVYQIVEFQHVKPGKGGAFVRTKMRKVKSGSTIERTFRSGEKIEPVFIEKTKMQFLYRQGDDAVLMDLDTYEQTPLPIADIGDQAKYLLEEMEIVVVQAEGETLGYEIPNFVEQRIVQTDPGYKGDTVSGSTKPATLESGATVLVPFHISQGDVVKVDTRSHTYLERVKQI